MRFLIINIDLKILFKMLFFNKNKKILFLKKIFLIAISLKKIFKIFLFILNYANINFTI